LVNCDWHVFKCSDTNAVFQTAMFSFWSEEVKKGPQALTAKLAAAFPEVVYITVILYYLSSLNRLNV